MEINDFKKKIYDLAFRAAEDGGFELIDVDMHGRGRKTLLRVTIDKEGGVTIGNCERMSRSLEALLDVEDPIKESYMLEVSSPGLDRPLTKQKDFEKNTGKLVRIITKEKIGNQTFFTGRIIDVGEDWIRLKIEEPVSSKKSPKKRALEGERDIFIPIHKISRARLEIES
ncbi:MAG: ribosome maturation factor RimP [Thermodesulfovibrio sp.]|nr:ribosome maturation factor RimP [Thermodesulfovibrio sp.]